MFLKDNYDESKTKIILHLSVTTFVRKDRVPENDFENSAVS